MYNDLLIPTIDPVTQRHVNIRHTTGIQAYQRVYYYRHEVKSKPMTTNY